MLHPRSNTAVRVNLSLIADRSDDLRQRASATDGQTTAPTMGGYHSLYRSGVDRTACIVSSKHAFHDHRESAHGSKPADCLEVDRRIAGQPSRPRSGLLVGSHAID